MIILFTAEYDGRIPTTDALRDPGHRVALELVLRPDENAEGLILEGQATALNTGTPLLFALSSYVRLTRTGGAPETPAS